MRTNERVGHGVAASALLALAVAVHALLLWRVAAHQVDLDHDSTISYLAATGHQAAWERLPADQWTTAAAVQRLFRVDEAWPLRRIQHDLARTDLHPPLYFWLLHAQLLATGPTPWSALVLNGLLGVLTVFAVYSIGRRLWDAECGAGAALLWAASYGAMMTASEARPYALSALLATVLIRLALEAQDRGLPPARGVALAVVIMLGLLTHYQFALVIVAALAGLLLAGAPRGAWRSLVLPLLLGVAGFVLVHPEFAMSLARQRAQTEPFTLSDLQPRLEAFAFGLEGLARPARTQRDFLWIGGALIAWSALRALRHGAAERVRGAWGRLRASTPGVRRVAWSAVAFAAMSAALYLGHVSPAHAAGARYNAVLWPLLALLAAGAVRDLSRDRATLPLLAIAVGVLSYAVAIEVDASQLRLVRSPAWQALTAARALVADHTQRGLLPRSVLHVAPGTPLWIVRAPADTVALPAAWAARGVPVTFLLQDGPGDPRVRRMLERASAAGDSVASAGAGPAGTEVVTWAPRRAMATGTAR